MPMESTKHDRRDRKKKRGTGRFVRRLVQDDTIHQISSEQYRRKVRDVYGGFKGAVLAGCSLVSLHSPMGDRLLKKRKFDLRGAREILDVGSGAGQITRHLLRYTDPEARITGFDLSSKMLVRARTRLLRSAKLIARGMPGFVTADMTRLPFADESFDCVTCGYVLEHLPDPRPGLQELHRVMRPLGRMLLFATEDSFGGAWTSRLFCCRTYNREDLRDVCEEIGLHWKKELWFTPLHRFLKAGGICVEMQKRER